MRKVAINLLALSAQRELIDQAASLLDKNRSDFRLEASCERAQAVILDQVDFKLDAENHRRFSAMLDTPPARNAGLVRLMATEPPWRLPAGVGKV